MADVNLKPDDAAAPSSPAASTTRVAEPLTAEERPEIAFIELLFFAYRDFISDPDAALLSYGFGRAHHRVIHFVNRHPGIRVADLLDILKITKQSLSRVLGQLLRQGFIQQRPGADRRQRLLDLTASGAELERRLTEDQRALVARAYRAAGADAVDGFRNVLFGLINEEDRSKVARSVGSPRR